MRSMIEAAGAQMAMQYYTKMTDPTDAKAQAEMRKAGLRDLVDGIEANRRKFAAAQLIGVFDFSPSEFKRGAVLAYHKRFDELCSQAQKGGRA